MNKRRIMILHLCLIAAASLLAVQFHLRQHFGTYLPRLEVCFRDSIPPAAADALIEYGAYAEGNRLVIAGEGLSILLAQEVQDILTQSGIADFSVHDRTQAGRLAEQSWTLWLLIAGIFLLALMAERMDLDCRDLRDDARDALRHMYFGEWLKESAEKLLTVSLRWAGMVWIAVIVIGWLTEYRIYLPAEVLPPETIFDIPHYLHLDLPGGSGSAYDDLCRTLLPMLYGLSALAVLLTAAAAWLIHKLLRCRYAKKIYRREYHG